MTNLETITTAAKNAQTTLGLKYTPTVIRNEATAFHIAASCVKAQAVMLGEGAYWVVCLADAARLEDAGYEWAPRC
jgi:hypothetical protein